MGCKFEPCPGSQFFPFESIRNRTRGLLAQEPLTVTKMQRGVFSLQMLVHLLNGLAHLLHHPELLATLGLRAGVSHGSLHNPPQAGS